MGEIADVALNGEPDLLPDQRLVLVWSVHTFVQQAAHAPDARVPVHERPEEGLWLPRRPLARLLGVPLPRVRVQEDVLRQAAPRGPLRLGPQSASHADDRFPLKLLCRTPQRFRAFVQAPTRYRA